jgi:hypothetical protein
MHEISNSHASLANLVEVHFRGSAHLVGEAWAAVAETAAEVGATAPAVAETAAAVAAVIRVGCLGDLHIGYPLLRAHPLPQAS